MLRLDILHHIENLTPKQNLLSGTGSQLLKIRYQDRQRKRVTTATNHDRGQVTFVAESDTLGKGEACPNLYKHFGMRGTLCLA